MKAKQPWILCGLAALFALTAPVFGQDAKKKKKPALDDLLARHYETIGGVEAHKKHKTRKIEGTMNVGEMGQWKITILQKAPNSMFTRVEIGDEGDMLQGCDGKAAWKHEPGQDVKKLEGAEAKAALRDAMFYASVEMKKVFKPLTYEKRQKVDGKRYHVLKGGIEDNQFMTFYLNAKTHLIDRMTVPIPDLGQALTIQMGDYRDFDGIKMPCSLDMGMPLDSQNPFSIKMKFDKVTHGVDINDAVFAMPGENASGPQKKQ